MNCRLCLKECESPVPIFAGNKGDTLSELIYKYLFIKIEPEDVFSRVLCETCTRHLKNFQEFHEFIQKSQLELQKMQNELIGQHFIIKEEFVEIDEFHQNDDSKEEDENQKEPDPETFVKENVKEKGKENFKAFTGQQSKESSNSFTEMTFSDELRIPLPNADEVDRFLKADNENATLLKIIMLGVSNIVETTETKLSNKINDLGTAVENLRSEFWSLRNQQQPQKNQARNIEKNYEAKKLDLPQFPLSSVMEIQNFNDSLEDETFYATAFQHIQRELNLRTHSGAMYTRRLQLKKMMFTDLVLTRFTWKIPSGRKIHIFSKLKAILRLFIDVVNYNLSVENPTTTSENLETAEKRDRVRNVFLDERTVAQYFMESLKRDGKSKDVPTVETPPKIAKTE